MKIWRLEEQGDNERLERASRHIMDKLQPAYKAFNRLSSAFYATAGLSSRVLPGRRTSRMVSSGLAIANSSGPRSPSGWMIDPPFGSGAAPSRSAPAARPARVGRLAGHCSAPA